MTVVSVGDFGRWEQMEKVAEKTMEGLSATAISKALNIPRKEVLTLQEDYRVVLSSDSEARDLARDHLNMMVKHYDRLIKKTYDLMEDIDSLSFNHNVASQKNAAIKLVAELEAKRLDALQKAGLLDSAELGDELADAEEKREIILDILRNELCADCKRKVAYKMSKVSGKSEIIEAEVIDDDE